MRHPASVLAVIALVSATACGSPPGTRPRDMSARAHRDRAVQHYRQAERSAAHATGWYYGSWFYGAGYPWSPSWYPYRYSWDPGAVSNTSLGDLHLAAAQALEREYRDACALVPPAVESRSPFAALIPGHDAIADGVVIHLRREAGPPERLLHHMRCHRAWLALQGPEAMRASPLGLDKLRIAVCATPVGVDVVIQSQDPDTVAELVGRVRQIVPSRPAANRPVPGEP